MLHGVCAHSDRSVVCSLWSLLHSRYVLRTCVLCDFVCSIESERLVLWISCQDVRFLDWRGRSVETLKRHATNLLRLYFLVFAIAALASPQTESLSVSQADM